MLTVMAVLIVGAMVLQEYASRRGNETIRIVIQKEQTAQDDDEPGSVAGEDDGSAGQRPVSELHAKARVAARRGLLKEAIPLFEEALAQSPDSAAILGELGYWLTVADQPSKALPRLEKADQLSPSAQSALRMGNVRRALGDPEGAEREYRRALALQPTMTSAQIALGNQLRRRGALKESIAILETAVQSGSNEDRARALVALGSALAVTGRRDEAGRAFDRAIQFAPARAEIRVGVARGWQATGKKEDLARALGILGRAADLAPDLPSVWYALGRARERSGDDPGALEAYDRLFRIDPSNRQARRRAVKLAVQARDFTRARHDAERLLADSPDDPENVLLAASVADKDGRKEDARRLFRTALDAAKGKSPEAWAGIGQLERGAGNVAAARAAYRKALEQRPAYTSAWLSLGKLEEAAGRLDEAEKAWRQALAVEPRFAPAWLALGQLHSDQKRIDEAIADFRQALAVRPGYPAAELSLGVVLARAGRMEEAIATYTSLVGREPRYVSAWFDLGIAYRRAGRSAEARAALQKAIELDDGHLPSRRELGDLDLAEGRLTEAKSLFQEVLDLAPGDLTSRVFLAQIQAREGDRAGCVASSRRLLQEAPSDPRVQALAALCAAAAATAGR